MYLMRASCEKMAGGKEGWGGGGGGEEATLTKTKEEEKEKKVKKEEVAYGMFMENERDVIENCFCSRMSLRTGWTGGRKERQESGSWPHRDGT